jgi:leucyl-tRNA synthetase
MKRYSPAEIEKKWQQTWDESQIYKADLKSDKPKYIAMSMFNYPSGAGIHIGHAMNYTISDVMARVKRQQGYESYHPVGWDSFGLPAENFAIKTGVSPQASMAKIIPDYHTQYKAMGWSNDWSKEIATHEPIYYKWTQWIFSQMHKNGLAYQDARMQWWCTKCQTVLANEQVIDGKCWRHDSADDPIVEKKEVKQWFFKITDYADELLDATDALDWSEVVKTAQKNWIGKSKGAEIEFEVEDSPTKLKVFTTRPDTLFGATFLVVAPELEFIEEITTDEQKDKVSEYIKVATKKTEIERQASKEKTGVFTGSYAIHPVNGEKMPIWVADYVLGGYGTGAIMAVPAHDERDFEFAKKFDLPIRTVVVQDFGQPLEDTVDAKGSVVIVYDPKAEKFLGVKTGTNDGLWLNGGGTEGDETFEQTAIRELREETGFADYQKLVALGEPVYSYYFNDVKKVNKRSFGQGFLFFVDKDKQGEAAPEAHENFEHDWYSYDDLVTGVTNVQGGVEHWLEMLRRAKTIIDNNGAEFQPELYHGEGVLINSGDYDGLTTAEAREKVVADLEKLSKATEKVNYKLRDWSVSRQRYWGAPIPIINCEKCGPVLVPDEQLPVVLPELVDFQPSGDGRSALARATDWLEVDCPQCGGKGERETDTLDTYICSSWYMLRYFDPTNTEKIFDSEIDNKWMPIDFYNGADHATAHMIYARFVTRFFSKIGLIDNPEPFKKFLFNGKVTASDGTMFSKSKGNGVDPLEIINQGYGADALRTYLMFAAPLDLWVRWDSQGVPGTFRFISRVWNLVQEFIETKDEGESNEQLLRIIHPAIHKVTHDMEEQKYNTAIAAMMKATNELYEFKAKQGFADRANWQFTLESLVMLLAPFAPHAAEELWHDLGHEDSVNVDHWPEWQDKYLVGDTITLAVQINGKVRAELSIGKDASREEVEAAALEIDRIKEFTADKKPARVIYVPGRLVNIVIS